MLLVDDSRSFLAAAREFIEAERVTVVGEAASGPEALDAVARLRPDLVLMDLAMPGMNGLEATHRIKALPDPPRVIVLTLHDGEEYRRAAVEAHADGFVAKSALAAELVPMICRMFPVAVGGDIDDAEA